MASPWLRPGERPAAAGAAQQRAAQRAELQGLWFRARQQAIRDWNLQTPWRGFPKGSDPGRAGAGWCSDLAGSGWLAPLGAGAGRERRQPGWDPRLQALLSSSVHRRAARSVPSATGGCWITACGWIHGAIPLVTYACSPGPTACRDSVLPALAARDQALVGRSTAVSFTGSGGCPWVLSKEQDRWLSGPMLKPWRPAGWPTQGSYPSSAGAV